MATPKVSENLVTVFSFTMRVYAPMWFNIKKESSIIDGCKHMEHHYEITISSAQLGYNGGLSHSTECISCPPRKYLAGNGILCSAAHSGIGHLTHSKSSREGPTSGKSIHREKFSLLSDSVLSYPLVGEPHLGIYSATG